MLTCDGNLLWAILAFETTLFVVAVIAKKPMGLNFPVPGGSSVASASSAVARLRGRITMVHTVQGGPETLGLGVCTDQRP